MYCYMKYLEIKCGKEILNIEVESSIYLIMFEYANNSKWHRSKFYVTVIDRKTGTRTTYADTELELGEMYSIQYNEIQCSISSSVRINDTISRVESTYHEETNLIGFELGINDDVFRGAVREGGCSVIISDNNGIPQISFSGTPENAEYMYQWIKYTMKGGDEVKIRFDVLNKDEITIADIVRMTI